MVNKQINLLNKSEFNKVTLNMWPTSKQGEILLNYVKVVSLKITSFKRKYIKVF